MSEKNSTVCVPAADARRESDAFDKLLWSDSTEEEYLQQMIGGKNFDSNEDEEEQAETSTLPGAIKAMDDINVHESASINNRFLSKSLERILRFGKKEELQESDIRSDSARDELDLVGSNNDDDNNTVDEMIEESERQEETYLNNILEIIPASSDSLLTEPSAEMTSTKDIRINISKTVQSREVSLANYSKKKSLTGAMNNDSSSSRSRRNRRDANDSLAGDETVGKIVTHIMDGGNSTAEGEEERTLRSWTDFQPIAGSVATPLDKSSNNNNNNGGATDIDDGNNKFVSDETSVGSITEEIQVIVAKHKMELDEVGGIQNMAVGEAGTLLNTMISSLSADESCYSRARSFLGGIPFTDQKAATTPPTSKVEGEDANDVEKGENECWCVDVKNIPSTPVRFSYNTPSPQNSVGKLKEAPGTPSTVIISRHPLGLATPTPSDMDADEYEGNQYTRNSYSSNIERMFFTGWGYLAFLKRVSAKYGRFYLWVIIGAVVMLALSFILVIAVFTKLGKPTRESNEAPPSLPLIAAPEAENIFNLDTITIDLPPSEISPTLDWTFVNHEDELSQIDDATISPDLSIIEDADDTIDQSQTDADFVYFYERLRKIISERLPETLSKLEDPKSPQFRALEWLRSNPPTIEEMRFKPLEQKYVLAVLYFTTNGEEWFDNSGWLSSNDECEWFSTSNKDSLCDSIGRIIEIDLISNNLKGTIPSELSLLSENLTEIRVNGNSLFGTLPSFIGEMTNLVRFHVHWNFFSGTILTNLGGLSSSLLSLRLGKNNFVGTLPWQLRDLQNLEALDIRANELTGTIPFFLGDLSALTDLNLSNNEFSGTIPFELMNVKSLINLELDRNNLTGIMPTEVCSRLPFLEIAKVDCQEVECWCCEGCND